MEARVGIQSATHVPNFPAFGVCGQQRYPVWYPAARADFLVRPWTSLRVRRNICTYSSPLHMMNTICVYGRATLFTDAFTNDLLMRLCQPGPLTPKNQRTSGARRQDIEFVFAVNFGLAFHSCARTARRRRLSHFYSQSSTWWRSLVDYILLLRAELGWHSVRRLRGGVVEQRGKQAEAVHRQDYLKCMYNMHILSDEP
jgi:hypothetical protein